MKNNIIAQASELWYRENDITAQELSNIGDANVLLNVTIESLINKIEKYKRRPNASEMYIKSQNNLISSLIEINQIQKFYLYHDYLIKINEIIMSLLNRDPNLSGINLKIVFNDRNSVFATEKIGIKI